MALHLIFTGTPCVRLIYWHSIHYLPALHVCDLFIGTPFITIYMQLLNLIIIQLSLVKLMALQLTSVSIK